MMPTDDKLKRELARGPLKKSGFDDRLRRRIEERLDEGPSRRPFRLHRLAGAGLTLCVMIAAAVLLVRLHPMYTEEAQQAAETVAQETPADTAAVEDAEETHRRSVLLLGLRRDGADGEPSAYRTLLVSGGTDPSDLVGGGGWGHHHAVSHRFLAAGRAGVQRRGRRHPAGRRLERFARRRHAAALADSGGRKRRPG